MSLLFILSLLPLLRPLAAQNVWSYLVVQGPAERWFTDTTSDPADAHIASEEGNNGLAWQSLTDFDHVTFTVDVPAVNSQVHVSL